MKTRIWFIRHGETPLSARKIYYGITDAALNRRGITQAQELAARMSKEKVDKVYASDLVRASEFARIIFARHAIEITPHLREIDFGIFEGLTHEELVKKYPQHYNRWLRNPFGYRIPGGDSLRKFKSAFKRFVAGIITANRGSSIALVTHAGPIKMLLHDMMPREAIWAIPVDLASLTVVDFRGSCAELKLHNHTFYPHE